MSRNRGATRRHVTTVIAGIGLLAATLAGCRGREGGARSGPPTGDSGRPPAEAAGVPTDDPATVLVEVAGKRLTAGEADRQAAALLAGANSGLGPEEMAAVVPRFRRQMIDRFVMETVVRAEIERRQLAASEAEVDAEVARIAADARLPAGTTLEEALRARGVTTERFRADVAELVKLNKLVPDPTSEEIGAFYEKEKDRFAVPEQARARHILIRTEDTDTAEQKAAKKARAEGIREQIVQGADFTRLAAEHSDCPSKANGGELPAFSRGEMVPPFEEAAFSQPTNVIGPLVETRFGYHIIQVLDRQAGRTLPLEEVRSRIGNHLKQQRLQALFNELKARAGVKYHKDYAPEAAPVSPPAPSAS